MPAPIPPHLRRAAHVRRVTLTVVAATAVVLGPTACDIGVAAAGSGGSGSYGAGHSGHGTADPTSVGGTSIETVPAGNTEELEPTPTATPTETSNPAEDEGTTGEGTTGEEAPEDTEEETAEETTAETTAPPTTTPPATPPPAPGLETLGADCSTSDLEPHDGFQNAPRCVATAFGEVADEDRSPSLLIVDPPTAVGAGEDFTLQVSTRNLVRDRFLGAAAGGYYRESSFLDADGIQRGHFHTACRLLGDLSVAPDAAPAPAFFLATQDNGGGAEPDLVGVPVTGLDEPGTYQCAVWAGDGSHRLPMMQRANQTPAFDMVRIEVG